MAPLRHRLCIWLDILHSALSSFLVVLWENTLLLPMHMLYGTLYIQITISDWLIFFVNKVSNTSPTLGTMVKYALSPLFVIVLAATMPLMLIFFLTLDFADGKMVPDIDIDNVRRDLCICWSNTIARSYPDLMSKDAVQIQPRAVVTFQPKPVLELEDNVTDGRMPRLWRERHISENPASELGGVVAVKARAPVLSSKLRLAQEWTPPGKTSGRYTE